MGDWRRSFLVGSVLLLAIPAAVGGGAGPLDGRTYEVEITAPGEDPAPDTLIFSDGTFDSVGCHEFGFGAVPYQAEKKGGAIHFTAEAKSETEGVAQWSGTVTGETIQGSMEWIKVGQDPTLYEFSGRLK